MRQRKPDKRKRPSRSKPPKSEWARSYFAAKREAEEIARAASSGQSSSNDQSSQSAQPSTSANTSINGQPARTTRLTITTRSSAVRTRNTGRTAKSRQMAGQSVYQPPREDQLFTVVDPACPNAANHNVGELCRTCRAIQMPWGVRLPIVRVDDGTAINVGPAGSLLDGVELRNETGVAVLSVVATLRASGAPYSSVPGLLQLMVPNGPSASAGIRIAQLSEEIAADAADNDEVPSIARIIDDALSDPLATFDDHVARITRQFENTRANESYESDSGSDSDIPSRPRGIGRTRFEDIEDELSDSEHTDFEEDEKVDEEDFIMVTRPPKLNLNKFHRPPMEKGYWEFMEGKELSDPVIGVPDTSKFFLFRRLIQNREKLDIREYPLWRSFDWSSPDDVMALKKHRAQNRHRIEGAISQPRPGWSQAEKDVLKALIASALAQGKNKKTINWSDIAYSLHQHFQGKVQKEGAKMAETTKWENGIIVKTGSGSLALKKLAYDRHGTILRLPHVIKGAAEKYADIKKMLDDSKPKKKSVLGREADEEEEGDKEDEEEDEEDEEDIDEPEPKRARRSDSPPPSGGAGGGISCR